MSLTTVCSDPSSLEFIVIFFLCTLALSPLSALLPLPCCSLNGFLDGPYIQVSIWAQPLTLPNFPGAVWLFSMQRFHKLCVYDSQSGYCWLQFCSEFQLHSWSCRLETWLPGLSLSHPPHSWRGLWAREKPGKVGSLTTWLKLWRRPHDGSHFTCELVGAERPRWGCLYKSAGGWRMREWCYVTSKRRIVIGSLEIPNEICTKRCWPFCCCRLAVFLVIVESVNGSIIHLVTQVKFWIICFFLFFFFFASPHQLCKSSWLYILILFLNHSGLSLCLLF